MDKSEGAPAAQSNEQVQEDNTINDQLEVTCTNVGPVRIGKSDHSDAEVTAALPVEDGMQSSDVENSLSHDEITKIVTNFLGLISAEPATNGSTDRPASHGIKNFTSSLSFCDKSKGSRLSSGRKKKSGKKPERKNSRSGSRNGKSRQPREKIAGPEPNTICKDIVLVEKNYSSLKRRGKRQKQVKENADDDYTKFRKQVRYVLNKIQYEQSLIDAYGGEGWKGLSIDKLRPEKELQRASSHIVRCKVRLRDLFQHLDTLCTEGSYPESMFDSEGCLDSEDIYCTICGSTNLSAGNDIVLCDGVCNRAFHQMCLKPPLLTEEIPPDDEGWLCPGCDCKFDCSELVNDSLGTNLSMNDSWEKVFPEAAAATAGANIQEEILGLPSDDSEDDDFDPDKMDVDVKAEGYNANEIEKPSDSEKLSEGEESGSDESDFSSASEDLDEFINKEQIQGPPRDDSSEENYDDYDPDAPELDDQVRQESSSSDYTSDSEGFATELNDVKSKTDEKSDELLAALDTEQGSAAPVSHKRDIERLDYKKLFDETYGHASSDSSEDEDWSEAGPSRKRKIKSDKVVSVSPHKNMVACEGDEQSNDAERNIQEAKYVTPIKHRQKLKSNSKSSSPGKGKSKQGEAAIQKLHEAFKETKYPDRPIKDSLAKELGLSFQQVDRWFKNARWFHSKTVSKSGITRKSSSRATPGSKIATASHPSKTSPSQLLPGADATTNGSVTKISSSQKSSGIKAAGKSDRNKNLSYPCPSGSKAIDRRNGSKNLSSLSTGTPTQIDASKSPPQLATRRSPRGQEKNAGDVSIDESPNPITSSTLSPPTAQESSQQKTIAQDTNSQKRGKRNGQSSVDVAEAPLAKSLKVNEAQKIPTAAGEISQKKSPTQDSKSSRSRIPVAEIEETAKASSSVVSPRPGKELSSPNKSATTDTQPRRSGRKSVPKNDEESPNASSAADTSSPSTGSGKALGRSKSRGKSRK